jgi:hypothetical protein
MTAETETEAQATPTAGAQRPALPEGIVSPIAALNHLKQKGHAPQEFKPQQMYGFVKNPGKVDPFPVKHYDAEGNEFDSPQVNEHGITTTRPGVKHAEVVDWWGRKGERAEAKAKEKAEKAKAKAEKEAAKAAGTTVEASESDGADDESSEDEEFEDVEDAQ